MGNNVRGTRSFSFDLDIKSRGLASLKLWTRLFVFFNIEKMYYLSAEKQPKWIQDALYENASDAKSASRVIDLYKADNGISTNTNVDLSAAKAVTPRRGRSTPQADAKTSYLKESVVNKMSTQEYEKNQDKIMEAIRTGKFVYDLSGGAR